MEKSIPDPTVMNGSMQMSQLRQRMAENGFESNENYDYILKCLQSQFQHSIRCLNIQGDCGRRKTAFANALARSINVTHILYHDFSEEDPTKQIAATLQHTINNEEAGKQELPIESFDRIMSDTCALSEAESTILIIDQLQAADFQKHIHLYKFLTQQEWRYGDAMFHANRQNLTIYLISERRLYHSLQKQSFRVWIPQKNQRNIQFKAADFGLDDNIEPVLQALHTLFQQLQCSPTFSEYQKLLYDVEHNILSITDLKQSLFGWIENIDNDLLYSDTLQTYLNTTLSCIQNYIGIEENVELTTVPTNLTNQTL